jgi:hypothetical protein
MVAARTCDRVGGRVASADHDPDDYGNRRTREEREEDGKPREPSPRT